MQSNSIIDFKVTSKFKSLGNLHGIAYEMAILDAYKNSPKGLMVVQKDSFDVSRLYENIIKIDPSLNIKIFPEYETLPYDAISPHQDIISERLSFLITIGQQVKPLIITSISAILQRLAPLDFLLKNSFILNVGDQRDLATMKSSLIDSGYTQTNKVLEHGEFSLRGEIIDIFPMGSDFPYRIDFFDDEVEHIYIFDIDTQRSIKEIKNIKIIPAHEFPLDKGGISIFRSNYRDNFLASSMQNHVIYQAISKGAIPAGIEYYLPLFFASTATLFDYIGKDLQILVPNDYQKLCQDFDVETHKRASLYEGNPDHPPLSVYKVFLSPDEFNQKLKQYQCASLCKEAFSPEKQSKYNTNAKVQKIENIAFNHQEKNNYENFNQYVDKIIQNKGRVLITAISEGRRQSLREILPASIIKQYGIKPASSFIEFLQATDPLMMTIAPFYEGCYFENDKLAIITETELFGQQIIKQKKRSHRSAISAESMINNLAQLSIDQVVVHIDHGIGRYKGLKILEINGIKGEYLQIEYQNGDMLNIPITSLNKVARYSGSENPSLSKLGHDNWGKRKLKAAQKVRDVAAQLLDLYAKRQAHEGHKFIIDEHALDEFALGFNYEETVDQKNAIDATLADMQKSTPMDRLICGDVGFGKTEVALRAAFVAAHSGMQVAVLVPTTILAEQHYQTFKDRFAKTALIVEELSRFKSAKQQNAIIENLKEGKIDIIIGTHKLLSKEIKFKNLGLVIIDEEHRFGVRQKERLKELRAQVDLLTLTATPIPRTLNMSLEGMRELSIIATPPMHRLAVKTFVLENSDQVCREAIMRELRRGGQIYYLHNDVSTINQKAEQLQKLVPEATIDIGHGQMRERELQKVMKDFTHQRFNLLLCSTIVENGLDVPTANTIIIDRADLLGLAQLHQIRGRVGRSHHQAYAYLFTPPKQLLSKDAKRRLEAIASLEELGAGFVLATHDLEIRGAGELLGEDQSGQIEQIGFSLYMEMLNAAVKALKSGKEPSLSDITLNDCDIDMHLPALFPDEYIGDINTRLSLYKRLASCKDNNEMDDLKVELIDRFGTLPESAKNLFIITKLKNLATDMGLTRINGDEKGGIIEFGKGHKVDPNYLLKIITSCKHGEYKLIGENTLRYTLQESVKYSRLEILEMLLKSFASHAKI